MSDLLSANSEGRAERRRKKTGRETARKDPARRETEVVTSQNCVATRQAQRVEGN
jgi:hypothetical protein